MNSCSTVGYTIVSCCRRRGFKRDGASTLYRRFSVPAGTHRIEVRLKDHLELPGYNYTKQAEVTLVPGQVFVVDFNARQGGFIFK